MVRAIARSIGSVVVLSDGEIPSIPVMSVAQSYVGTTTPPCGPAGAAPAVHASGPSSPHLCPGQGFMVHVRVARPALSPACQRYRRAERPYFAWNHVPTAWRPCGGHPWQHVAGPLGHVATPEPSKNASRLLRLRADGYVRAANAAEPHADASDNPAWTHVTGSFVITPKSGRPCPSGVTGPLRRAADRASARTQERGDAATTPLL